MAERELPVRAENPSKRKGIWVGRVVAVQPHKHADYLYVATFQIPKLDSSIPFAERFGQDTYYTIVFGGNRELKPNELAPVALPGTILPNGEKVRARKYRGVLSEGMLLSSDELGWTIGGPDEVAVLDQTVSEPGAPLTGPYSQAYSYAREYCHELKMRKSPAIPFFTHCGYANREREPRSPITTYRIVETPSGTISTRVNEHLLKGTFDLSVKTLHRK